MTIMQKIMPEGLVSPDEVERFRKEGAVKLSGVLGSDEIDLLRTAVDQQFADYGRTPTAYDFQDIARQIFDNAGPVNVGGANRFDWEHYRAMVKADKNARPLIDDAPVAAQKPGEFFYEAAGWRKYDEIRQVAMDSVLPEISAVLLNSEYVNFWDDTTFIKTPGATQRTAFHQDKAYFQISGAKCCIIWIPLDPADEETGAIEYVRGSHRWGKEFAPNVFFAQTKFSDSDGEGLPDIEGDHDNYDIVRIDAEPGDVIIDDVLTVHGAGGNKSASRNRRGISFSYCGDDIRYHDRPGAIPQPWIEEKLAEGAPLNCRDYPRVWPRPFPGAKISQLYRQDDENISRRRVA